MKLTAFFVLLVVSIVTRAQDTAVMPFIDVSRIATVDTLTLKVTAASVPKTLDLQKEYSSLNFQAGLVHKKTIPPSAVHNSALLRFRIFNSADSTIGLYFFPGLYCEQISIYRVDGTNTVRLPDMLPQISDSIGFRYISLGGGDTATIVARMEFVKTYVNALRPRLINENYIQAFNTQRTLSTDLDIATYVLCGLLLMMILFSIASYTQGANPEFLIYSGYALFIGLMLFTKSFYSHQIHPASFFVESYLDFIMQCLGILFYMVFMQRFLETKKNYGFLYRFYNYGIVLMVAAIFSFTGFHFFSENFFIQNLIETWTKYFLLVMIIVFMVYSLGHWKDRLLRYLFWGNLALFILATFSQLMITFNIKMPGLPRILNASIFYYELGLLLELIFFLMGLSFKNKQQIIWQTQEREGLKAENQRKEYEKELAVYKAQQEERNRISADMHDELGSGMTAIRLMSEIAKKKMKENQLQEIDKISSSADDLLNKMNAIIWSMNSGNDTLDNLVSYIRAYSLEYFDGTPINCKVSTPKHIPNTELTGDKRRNIFLCVKESLNNVMKHSKASEVRVDVEANGAIIIRITDNGVGIDMQNLRQFGNGLQNIARRMNNIGGSFHIENEKGTSTTLVLPLN